MNKAKRIRWIVIYILIGILCVCLLYFALDLPSFSPEMAMHRKEAAELVGPSKVIAAEVVEYFGYDKILLGETENGYCLFEYLDSVGGWESGVLTYIGKDEARICFVPDRNVDVDFGEVLPVYAVPGNSRAVRARLTLETTRDEDAPFEGTYTNRESGQDGTYTTQAQLRQGVFFLFEVDITEMDLSVRKFWKYRFQDYDSSYGYISGTATLELFDSRGEVIETIVMEFPATM